MPTDVFLGYEQTAFQFRNGPEKFAAKNTSSNNIVSLGAETYYYTVGGDQCADRSRLRLRRKRQRRPPRLFITIPPTAVTATNNAQATQRIPFSPTDGQAADIYVKIGYQFHINTCFIYYTTDGSNPEGAFGVGKGTTQVAPMSYVKPRQSGEQH